MLLGIGATGRAEPETGDGLYRRFAGDLTLSSGACAALTVTGDPKIALDLRARYLDSIGVLAAPEWALADQSAAVAVAIEIRPLFLARFLTNAYSGRAWVDLVVDSIGAELGTWLGPSDGHFGAAWLVGGGVEAPLNSRGDRGFWLRLALRYLRASASDQAAPSGGKSEVSVLAALIYRTTAKLGLASWEPAD
jgi:hypothetical protein